MTKLVSSAALFVLSFSIASCSAENDSGVLALGDGLKAEGFLVVKDVVADTAGDGFLVSCAGSGGVKTSKYTRSEIEQNKICLPEPSPDGSSKDDPTTPPAPDPVGDSAGGNGFVVEFRQGSFIKASAGMNITRDKSSLTEGKDYCSVVAQLNVTTACKSADGVEIQVSGVSISGCQIQSGYLYEPHVSVAPAPKACE